MSEHKKTELEIKAENSEKKAVKDESPKKNKPAVKQKKSGRLSRYFREMRTELKKVTWPTKKQTTSNTGVVLLCVAVVGVFVWIFDGIASQLIGALLNLFGG